MIARLVAVLVALVIYSDAADAFIRGRLVCGLNVAAWRHVHGLSVPGAPAVAASWLTLARRPPHKGAVLVTKRPGGRYHVAIFVGGGMCLNPSSRAQAWQTKPCNSIWRGLWRTYRG